MRRVDSGKTKTFVERESALSGWMADNARIAWIEAPKPWVLEDPILKALSLPLNIQGNVNHPFCARLKELRKRAARRSAKLEIVLRRKAVFRLNRRDLTPLSGPNAVNFQCHARFRCTAFSRAWRMKR